jgi:hypothetical protein
VQECRIARQDISRYIDSVNPSPLVFPIVVHQRISIEHTLHIFLLVSTFFRRQWILDLKIIVQVDHTSHGLRQESEE